MSYSQIPQAIVIDASAAVGMVLPLSPIGESSLTQLSIWHRSRTKIYAPEIWLPEVVSVIRQGIFTKIISKGEGDVALEDVFQLGVEIRNSDINICQKALSWAERFSQSKAYDGFYLALSEELGAELWTADQKLWNRARQVHAPWVHWIAEGK
jgi:predicted nucleic acid-binding protein